ncbi:AI-2E family transporter [Marinomonas sp. CT5]|uniref:AI-2E family transporter n=1 Tax=Marinomonas sp. CT5 TaxID=2066133 RepID=UPI0017E83920|nr:AI-2E family transporter [Marinomonas sp. CT5]NVK72587.1 AI-2E family transporter [Oceanospirillaceae bacterium]QUX94062.1 AI-2E family transporter [Marinomonas sp. CT5]
MGSDYSHYMRRLLATIGIIAIALSIFLLLWHLAYVLVILFGGALFGVFLVGLASPLQVVLPLPRWSLVVLVATVLGGLLTFACYVAGPAIADQMVQLSEQLNGGLNQLQTYLKQQTWGEHLLNWAREQWQQAPLSPGKLMGQVTGAFSSIFGAFADLFVMLFIGFYLALHPKPYIQGFLFLFPREKRDRLNEVMSAVYHALKWWLIGRATSMAAVGVLTAVGLWVLDMPLIMALAVMAGLLSFVPFIGPIAAAIPAILVGLIEGPTQALYVVMVYFIVQLLESNILTPYVQKKAVSLPPAVMLSGQMLMGAVFGLQGLALSTPMLVSLIVIVQMLYVCDVLGEKIRPLGQ